jgi:hypothetical protein
MQRWIVILLLVFTPLQLSWAAVSGYCQHESNTSSQAQHPGHHEHEHKSGDSASDSKVPTSKMNNFDGTDTDCASCHAGCCAALIVQTEIPSSQVPQHMTATQTELFFRSAIERPERPQWNHLA